MAKTGRPKKQGSSGKQFKIAVDSTAHERISGWAEETDQSQGAIVKHLCEFIDALGENERHMILKSIPRTKHGEWITVLMQYYAGRLRGDDSDMLPPIK